MRHIKDILAEVVPQRWTAHELCEQIRRDRSEKTGIWRPSVKRVSCMLKLAATNGKLQVRRKIENERLVVWYEGPVDVFNDIRKRA